MRKAQLGGNGTAHTTFYWFRRVLRYDEESGCVNTSSFTFTVYQVLRVAFDVGPPVR